MARNAHKLVGAQAEYVGRSGKILACNLSVSGDRIWELREGDVTGNVLYKVNAALKEVQHQDLNLGFKTALFVKVASGTTGEFNLIYE